VLNEVRKAGLVSLPPRSLEELRLTPDSASAVERLRAEGFVLLIVTNQPDVARGTINREVAIEITDHIVRALGLDDGYLCLHDRADGCDCRKPEPGMLVTAARDWNVTLGTSWLIGDRWVDIAAARAAGVRSILLDRPYSWMSSGGKEPPPDLQPDIRCSTLSECVDELLRVVQSAEQKPLGFA